MRRAGVLLLALAIGSAASAAVFQYQSALETERGSREVSLWIPPDADRVRGIILAGMTLMEEHFVKDAKIRAACEAQQLAIVFTQAGLGGTPIQQVLDDFAATTGYAELSVAPLLFVGHSAGGGPAQQRAAEMASRCFGLVQYRGGMPSADNPIPPGIPSLAMLGQFDEFSGTMRTADGHEGWERARDVVAGFRSAAPAHLASLVVEPGAGHFAWSDRNAGYLALFIAKAAQARIPPVWDVHAGKPPRLLDIDCTQGWLTDLALGDAVACAPYATYAADKTHTSWHFDRELAEATLAYHKGLRGKQDQFLKWNDGFWVDAGSRFFFTDLKWIEDGRTLEVHPAYADAVPMQYDNQGPKWPNAGTPATHAATPITVKAVAGPLVATGPNTLRLRCDTLSPAGARFRATFMACSEGDETYRYTEHVGMMPRGFGGLNAGKAQTITFPELTDVRAGDAPQPLAATSDAGTPVDYYVAHGPAVIEAGYVRVTDIPRRATYPIAVKVVAYHFGSGVEPLVKTANPVARTFRILAAQ